MPSYAKFDVWQNTAGVNYNPILQVQSTTLTSTFTSTTLISSGGAAVTGLSVTITPKYTTSKILVFGHIVTGNNATTQAYYKLKRDSTEIGGGTAVSNRPGVIARTYGTTTNVGTTVPFFYLDSPGSVSLLTYQLYLGTESVSLPVYVNRIDSDTDASYGARGSSSITVMEIAQ
jgi:hypothetical protein